MNSLLTPGDTVGIISPSIVLSEKSSLNLDASLEYLHALGLKTVLAPTALTGLRLTPNSDTEKARDIMDMYRNPQIKALFAAHGGASSLRLLPLLDYEVIRANPKPIFGFSDSTTLQLGIYAQTGQPFVTGISLEYEFRGRTIHPLVSQSLQNILSGKKFRCSEGQTLNGGSAEGILLGECLSCITQLQGTPYFPSLKETLLLIEDECEPPYKIDQMLTQLKMHPDFGGVKGIIFGRFSECTSNADTHGTVNEVIDAFAQNIDIPVIKDFPFGHFPRRCVLPCGIRYRLDADACVLEQIA